MGYLERLNETTVRWLEMGEATWGYGSWGFEYGDGTWGSFKRYKVVETTARVVNEPLLLTEGCSERSEKGDTLCQQTETEKATEASGTAFR